MSRISVFFRRNSDTLWHKVFPIINLLLVGLSIWGNCVTNAGFCVPVVWAAVVQAVSFINIVTFTWLERTRLRGVNALLCGISTGVYAYWVLFLGAWVLLMPVPLWFLFLLVWRNWVHPVAKVVRKWYVAGMLLCVLFAVVCGVAYHRSCKAFQEGRVAVENPMTERIVGMHFLYHTSFCIYDGWRPPLHDPALVLGRWLHLGYDPWQQVELDDRVELYHDIYPDRPVVAPCACCRESERNGYFNDPLWQTLDFARAKELVSHEAWASFAPTDNNEWLANEGLPFAYPDSSYSRLVNLESGDTVSTGSQGSRFIKISQISFENNKVYRLTCEDDSTGYLWEILQFPAGKGGTVDFVTTPFAPRDQLYWLAAKSLNACDSLEIYYPNLKVRDTLQLMRVEMKGE